MLLDPKEQRTGTSFFALALGCTWIIMAGARSTVGTGESISRQEAHNLAPSLDEVVGMPEKEDWDPNWEVQAAALHADAVTSDGTPAFTMRDYPQMIPGNTARSEIVFSVEETSAVLAVIRARGLTVTPLINASVIEEAVCRNPNSDASRFISYGIFDLRKRCPPPSNGSTEAVSHRVLGLPLNVSARASWIDLVRTLKSTMDGHGRILRKMTDPSAQQHVVSESYFNSLGVVEGIWGTGMEM
ncbi:hypothetical protein N7513_007015 [Penicillium frequentans]|nr:hypothetical protein N7513_007015 [Penicillium glabrum]